ncbi:DUF2254 domain-containing protein [Pseudomonas sp. BMS12]|uniref:DUF2254 domain-containing protein n=1 Tax=Pseudomonas sp. BMS12 TaxID=1796033 RepID=UPI00083B9B32|nr:DUF2254 domain-containing protein [Pseudomonas sp. BMS12]
MTARWQWVLAQIGRRLWFRASLFSLLGVVSALLALAFKDYVPESLANSVGADAVDKILNIIATSMLTVTTFSLSIMVAAYSSATSTVTPRATPLVMEDNITQNALGTFIGSFLFSVVGIIALSTGAYGNKGRVLMFVVTIAVIALIVLALLRWIDHLAQLGRVGETSDRVEHATCEALRDRLRLPNLGGNRLVSREAIPANARAIHPHYIGYVQHIDMPALAELSASPDSAIYLLAMPGSFITPGEPLAAVLGIDPAEDDRLRAAFSVGKCRSFEQDPRFGAAVLAEIASRALSPAVNDPGTAIDILGRGVRVLALWTQVDGETPDGLDCSRIHAPDLLLSDLFDDLFTPIARDGAALIEVGIRLQKDLLNLALLDPRYRADARRHSSLALKRAEAVLTLEEDKQRLRELSAEVLAL